MNVLHQQFIKDGAEVDVEFTNHFLSWTFKSGKTQSVETNYILACKQLTGGTTLEIVFVCDKKDRQLEEQTITFTGPVEQTTKFTDEIQKFIIDSGRPRNLLVLVNPNSGKKNGCKNYKKRVLPLLNKCGVTADLKVTKKPNEPKDILKDYDLSSTDGVVAMGGDGFYSECMKGLILRQQRDSGVDVNDPTAKLTTPTIPLGIVPAGSGDYIVQYLHGTRCLKTAVLKILLGQTVGTNSASVHEGGRFVAYSGLVLGFGLFGDMMYDCEKHRWMGSTRYDIIPLSTIMTRRAIDVEVQYIPAKTSRADDSHNSNNNKFLRQMSLPADHALSTINKRRHASMTDLDQLIIEDEWKTIPCRTVYAVDTHPISMVAKNDRMQPHFGADDLTLTMTGKCSLTKHMAQLKKVKDDETDCYNFDFVQQKKVDGYRVRLLNVPMTTDPNGVKYLGKKFYINCDGEAIKLKHPQFEVRLHRNIVQLFGQQINNGSVS